MAFIAYVSPEDIPPEHRVADDDNIVRIHGVHPETIRMHYDIYRELMRGPGPLSRVQREMIAVTVSGANGCHY
jgi:alkylhydroperoxidase family enzyme